METRLIAIIGIMAAGLTALGQMVQVGNIGIAITRRNAGEPLNIVWVFPDSPAEGAGIKTNWFIISVDGKNVSSMSSQQCMSMLHGAVGTPVTLELADPAMSQTNRFSTRRADVKIPRDWLPHSIHTNSIGTFLIAE